MIKISPMKRSNFAAISHILILFNFGLLSVFLLPLLIPLSPSTRRSTLSRRGGLRGRRSGGSILIESPSLWRSPLRPGELLFLLLLVLLISSFCCLRGLTPCSKWFSCRSWSWWSWWSPGSVILTRRSTWFPPTWQWVSSTSWSGRESVSDQKTPSSSLSTTSSPLPLLPWAPFTRYGEMISHPNALWILVLSSSVSFL